jgi:hypothetical protein
MRQRINAHKSWGLQPGLQAIPQRLALRLDQPKTRYFHRVRRRKPVVNKNKVYVSVLTWAAVLGVFYLTRHHNYLIFHALSEMFSAAVTLAIFLLVWNMR